MDTHRHIIERPATKQNIYDINDQKQLRWYTKVATEITKERSTSLTATAWRVVLVHIHVQFWFGTHRHGGTYVTGIDQHPS